MTGAVVPDEDVNGVPAVEGNTSERPAWHRLVIKLHLSGDGVGAIAEALGQDRVVVAEVLTGEWGRQQCITAVLDDDMAAARVLKSVELDTIYTMVNLMETSSNERIRLSCATTLMHQGMGKPKQTVVSEVPRTSADKEKEILDKELETLTGN